MLIQFRFENHRSLRDEQTLSFVASSESEEDEPRLLHHPSLAESLLPTVAIYGANASGKSNVIDALAFMRAAVLDSHRLWEPKGIRNDPFRLGQREKEPSLYELQFVSADRRYRYGFSLDAERVSSEWLERWSGTSFESLYSRDGDRFELHADFSNDTELLTRLTRPNSLFLSAAAQNNHPALGELFQHFEGIRVIAPSAFDATHSLARATRSVEALFASPRQQSLFPDERGLVQQREAVLELLRVADLGILDIGRDESRRSRSAPSLLFRHRASPPEREAWLPLEGQSRGTLKLLELALPLLLSLQSGTSLWVDELDASLHPVLASHLLCLFHTPETNPLGAQLVFTTHDTHLLGTLLGQPPLRRDQVWFTEKSEDGATTLFPLSDFESSEHQNVERGYVQGRYGAIPFLDELRLTKGSE
ncbi:MAG: ATP-binding protein [Myxococcota bacterium]|nr:ATP-binding protein [Myxococcota bacterium]